MYFRSHTGQPIRLALLSGHVTIVGPEWRELSQIFHQAAFQAGCERSDQPPPPAQLKRDDGRSMGDHDAAYRAALVTMLSRNEEGDFTRDSLPNTNTVSGLCGFSARKEDVLRVFREMKEEAQAAADAETRTALGGGTPPAGDAGGQGAA